MRALPLLAIGLGACAAPIAYVLDFQVFLDGSFHGTAHIAFPCKEVATDYVFRLYPNHFGPFLSVSGAWVDGAEVGWEFFDPTAVVVFAPPQCQHTAAVTLEIQGRVPADPQGYGIFFRGRNTLALAQFYPILAPWDGGWRVHPTFAIGDNLVAEAADYVLHVRIPLGWFPVGSGQEEEVAPGVWRLSGTNLREMGLVLVRGFAERRVSHPFGVELRAVFPRELEEAAVRALEITSEALFLFTHLLGPYPYPDLDLVFVPLVGAGGVEYPRLILIGEYFAWDPTRPFFAEIVAHELAHQWWYGEVGTDQVAEPWLDEGLATYTSGLYFAAKGIPREQEWEASWAWAQRLNPQGSVGSPLWGFAASPNAQRSYSGYVYAGAALFLHEARKILGDEAFFLVLREFREEHRWGLASAARLLSRLRESGGPPLEALIAKYFGP